ncbi:(2Fe-2S) ferredoxin domain-containing protein [Nostoc sp.]|uniref:(2Fe-2S) ferredoxin domain-containing protein n=1 Tax=Nostoc sp. TaxID=1180 RepID=UPI002FF5F3EB
MDNATRYRVFVCTKQRDLNDSRGCCYNRDAVSIYQAFVDEIRQRQLEPRVEVCCSGCLDRCEVGAVALVTPIKGIAPKWLPTKLKRQMLTEKHWHVRLAVKDIPAILERHFVNVEVEPKT